MKEKELKILHVDFADIEARLIRAGASLVKDEKQINWVFSVDALKTDEGESGYLRLRSTQSLLDGNVSHDFTLKMKESNQEIRVYEEISTRISQPEALVKMMAALNHPVKYRGEKHRKSYEWKGILFEMDQWDQNTYPFPYLEIELNFESQLQEALDLLDLSMSDTTTKSIGDLRREWRSENAN